MKTSRKKMLLSSIAMLLVALVALGSATYAWFSVSKTVTANNIQVKAVTTAGLEISNTGASGTYTTTVSFADSETALKPISWAGTGNCYVPSGNVDGSTGTYSGTAYKSQGGTPSDFPTSGVQKTSNGFFAAYKVWVRSAADAGTTTYTSHPVDAAVKVTAGSPDGTSFVRARLVDETTAANTKNFWDADAGNGSAITSTSGTPGTIAYDKFASVNAVTATDTTATGKEYTLYVWYDGADEDCTDTLQNALANITLEFSAHDM